MRKNFIFDMDGTIYLGERVLKGSVEKINALKHQGAEIYFLTNNSSKNGEIYREKLIKMGFSQGLNHIMTSGEASGHYILKHYPQAKVYVLGTEMLKKELEDRGICLWPYEDADVVLLGFDTTLTYEKIWQACNMIVAGKIFLATHPDVHCPLPQGRWMPDTGAMIALFEKATGVSPIVIGKPHSPMWEAFVRRYGLKPEETVMVGDRLYTDIAFGIQNKLHTILVLTGETDENMYRLSNVKADTVLSGIWDIDYEMIKNK